MLRPLPPSKAAPGEEVVDRVVCASLASDTNAMYVQMERIRASSLRHNRAGQVHAALIYQSGWFLHWFEGPGPAVRELFERVRADPRHQAHRVLHHSHGRRFLPTLWSMMLSPSTEPTTVFGRRVADIHRQYVEGRQYPPTSVIRRISGPIRLSRASGREDPESYHRIGVAATGNEAFELVRWLSRRHDVPVVTRRFAGESDHDGGSDYVEWMMGDHPCRVLAVARTGLLHGLRRVFLADWPHLLLLFSGDARRDDPLMNRVRLACRTLPQCPELVGIAPDIDTHERMAQWAAADGLRYQNAGLVAPQDSAAVWQAMEAVLQHAGPPPSSAWAVEPGEVWR
jgi:hypothetical protein